MKRNILVDSDGLLYLAGSVGETTYYHAFFEADDGGIHQITRQTAEEIRVFDQEHEDLFLLERELVIQPGELSHCLQVVKAKLTEIKKRYKGDMYVYVKGDGTNFRDEIATIAPYKGNRSARKPHYLPDIKQYLIDNWKAIEVSGKEVDDQIATVAYESSKPYVICSPDKDLDQIPGLHWNYSKSVEYEIDPLEAMFFFWQQVLSGDSADNIKGAWKIGPGKAEKFITEFMSEETELPLEEHLWKRVVEVYEQTMGVNGCPYAGMPADTVALENARLVWMQTEARRLWTPPGTPKEYLGATLDD